MGLIYGGIGLGNEVDEQKVSILKEELRTYPTDEFHSINSGGLSAGLFSIRLRKAPFPQDQIVEDKVNNLILVADARLDYRADLVAKLELPADSIITHSDPELLLYAFNKWGKECLNHLEGDYVFLVYQPEKKEVWIARDPIGLRPLFFVQTNNQLYFSSSLKGLLKLELFAGEINEDFWLNRLLSIDCPLTASPHKKIHQVPMGHEVLISESDFIAKRFYWWERKVEKVKGKNYEAELKDILEKAVETRLYPDYEIGGQLSGGLDSSTVMSIASKKLLKKDKKKTIWAVSSVADKSQNHPRDERPWVEHFCSYFNNIDSNCITADKNPNTAVSNKKLFAFIRFRRYASFSIEREFQKYLEKRNCKTVLTGWRGDHYISRHSNYSLNELLLNGNLNYFIRYFNKASKWREISAFTLLKRLIKRNLPSKAISVPTIELLNPEWVALHHQKLKEKGIKKSKWERRDLEWDFNRILPQNGKEFNFYMEDITFLNKKPMYVLHPLSDRRVISYAINLPAIEFEKDGMDRSLLRRSMKDVLPKKIQRRINKGFFNYEEKERAKLLVDSLLTNHRALIETSSFSSYVNLKEVLTTVNDYINNKDNIADIKITESLNIIGYLLYFAEHKDRTD